jgi:hypothetical protein
MILHYILNKLNSYLKDVIGSEKLRTVRALMDLLFLMDEYMLLQVSLLSEALAAVIMVTYERSFSSMDS